MPGGRGRGRSGSPPGRGRGRSGSPGRGRGRNGRQHGGRDNKGNLLNMPTTMMRMRKQDTSVDAVDHFNNVVIYSEVREGPQDTSVRIAGLESVGFNPEPGYFYYNPLTETEQFDAVHCFAAVRNVKTMFDQTLTRMGDTCQWQWGQSEPLTILPRFRAESENPFTLNARYDRENKRLTFDVWVPSPDAKVYLSQSYDIVAHEAGHAVLDGLVPELLEGARQGHFETGGLHETFGDLTVIFSLLWQFDVVEAIMIESHGGVTLIEGFWNIMGENFGESIFGRDPDTQGIRNLNNVLTVGEIPEGAIDGLGVVFTASIFAALVDVFLVEKNVSRENPALTLHRIGQEFLELTIRSYMKAPTPTCTLEQMAKTFMKLSKDQNVKDALYNQFRKREIVEEKQRHGRKKKKIPPGFCKGFKR